jgi:membrane-bound lytic murein transglycosylase B
VNPRSSHLIAFLLLLAPLVAQGIAHDEGGEHARLAPLEQVAKVTRTPIRAHKRVAHFDMHRPEIVQFVKDVVAHDSLDRRKLLKLLSKAEPQPKIIEIMMRPAEKVTPWYQYQANFLTAERIAEGAQFYAEHRELLERISAEHGIPPEYLVAIIGVETRYGRMTGTWRVLDSLMTLAFDYPPRADYFRGELEQFLLLVKEDDLNPLTVTGSYAGAMGVPQFMPSSYRRFAVDGNTDNKRNLWTDWNDVLASIANYFVVHGWEPGGQVLAEARLDPDPSFQFDPHNLELNETLESLSAHGVQADTGQAATTPALLISAEQPDGPAYRIGFRNFFVITRYNHSARYAMAVHDLAEAIAQRTHGNQS